MRVLATMVMTLSVALAAAPGVHGQEERGTGLITGIDSATRTLTLETTRGPRSVVVAPSASVRAGQRVLAWADLALGDGVAYQLAGGSVTRLEVARQFWAIPPER